MKLPQIERWRRLKQASWQTFIAQFQNLQLNQFATWPLTVKLCSWLLIFLLVFAIGFVLAIQPQHRALQQARLEERQLLQQFSEQYLQLQQLQQSRQGDQALQKKIQQLSAASLSASQMPALISRLQQAAKHSKVVLQDIQIEAEQVQPYFIEQPISLTVVGDYHALALFSTQLAALDDLMVIQDFVMQNDIVQSQHPRINTQFKLLSYRYIDAEQPTKTVAEQALSAHSDGAVHRQQTTEHLQ
ncbi:type IV pilus inner membrane component PilO [Acinetobacter larvae]|uniref:Pilus assembly protein PilO n=1 Tax=Acinetobacter larvae TaxID=1789224 RepID=A0A1B2M2M7_9GAMM|nr:type 4a pilus biogenesis protein PilO [Acinetobacter larvae]AOA59442.1 hypothetical protein BFG52_14520 [Acinetobacter larvae]